MLVSIESLNVFIESYEKEGKVEISKVFNRGFPYIEFRVKLIILDLFGGFIADNIMFSPF